LSLTQNAPEQHDSVREQLLVRDLIDALQVHEMADIQALLNAIRGLRLPKAPEPASQIAVRVKNALNDDKKFKAVVRELGAPKAYTAAQLIEIYNGALDRNQRFPKSVTKKRILDQLSEEREIMLSNDFAGRVIAAHSKK
jgi:HPt (histidine-containing phosphotransfer) domain-containing protein